MSNGKTADLILQKYNTNKPREFWLEFYANYFGFHSDWDEFWRRVEQEINA